MAHYDGMREAHETDRAMKDAAMTDTTPRAAEQAVAPTPVWPHLIRVAGVLSVLMLSNLSTYSIATVEAQRDIRVHTVVQAGSPFFQGVFHGGCMNFRDISDRPWQACATDIRDSHVSPSTSHPTVLPGESYVIR